MLFCRVSVRSVHVTQSRVSEYRPLTNSKKDLPKCLNGLQYPVGESNRFDTIFCENSDTLRRTRAMSRLKGGAA